MKSNRFVRADERYLDFEDITEGSIILVQKNHQHGSLFDFNKPTYPSVTFEQGDIWVIESLANRPRVAVIRNLQRGSRTGIRVDALLELDDKDIVTVGPGPTRVPRDD